MYPYTPVPIYSYTHAHVYACTHTHIQLYTHLLINSVTHILIDIDQISQMARQLSVIHADIKNYIARYQYDILKDVLRISSK
jgi:hypothetical protein